MPLPTRELKITYGTTVLGGTSSIYFIDAPIKLTSTPDQAVVECDVIVVGASEGAFGTNCTNLETAFKTPRQFLEVKFGSSVHETFDRTVNTGFNAVPSITKVGSPDDTGRSRRYHIAVIVSLPADLYTNDDGSSTNARRSSSVNLYNTDANRRRLMLTGTYTASNASGQGAREQYNANIAAYVNGLLTGFGGTWEGPFDPQVTSDDQDKICNFSFTYEELIFNQSISALDDPMLRRQRLAATRSTDSPGDSVVFGLKPQRLQRVTVDYSVAVDKTMTQDLKAVYDGTVKPFLVSVAQSSASNSTGFIESEIPAFDWVENRISARISFISVPGGTLLSARITTDEAESTGVSLIPVWRDDRLKKYRFNGPGTVTRTVTIVTREVGLPGSTGVVGGGGASDIIGGLGVNLAPGGGGASGQDTVSIADELSSNTQNAGLANAGGVAEPTKSPDGGDLKRVFLGSVHSETPLRIGPLGGQTLDVVDRTIVARYEYFVDAADENNAGGT